MTSPHEPPLLHRLAIANPAANTPAYLSAATTGSDQLPWLYPGRERSAIVPNPLSGVSKFHLLVGN